MFMKVFMVFLEVTSWPIALACLYVFAWRPMRKTGRLTVDGALTIAFVTVWPQDPISGYSGNWFTYNAWMFNRGNWTNSIPFATGTAKPGAMAVEPLLVIGGIYTWIFLIGTLGGCALMKKLKARRPHWNKVKLVLACLVGSWIFDIILEGVLFMPLGIWSYPGGHFAIFPDTYHKFPLTEMLTAGTCFAVTICIRFFRNDKGETIADRGLENTGYSDRKKNILRAFAMIGIMQAVLLVFYNVPNSWTATRSTEWPADLQKRSYLTDGICGAGTDQACPGPNVPMYRNDNQNPLRGGSAHLDPNGNLVVPPDATLPTEVPFDVPPK
ncbi:spirocyclase AveC family protein [Mycobacterium syngnathidarum]